MQQSLYSRLFKEFLQGAVTLMEEQTQEKNYLQDRFLEKEFSFNGNWQAITTEYTNAMAYVTGYDSPFPRIANDSVKVTEGKLPKITAELYYTEEDLTLIDSMIATNEDANRKQILEKLFRPLNKCYVAQKERLEYMLKQGLSTGIAYADATNNTGAGISVDFGFKAENKFNASEVWTSGTATPLDDIINTVVNKSNEDGTQIVRAFMNQKTFNQLANDPKAKSLVYPEASSVANQFAPSVDRLNQALLAQFGFVIEIVKGKSELIQNGKVVKLDGWKDGMISFATEDKVGALVWAKLAEDNRRVDGIDYETAEDFILLRKYHTVTPNFAEYDSSQSRSLTVLKNNIYLLDTLATA